MNKKDLVEFEKKILAAVLHNLGLPPDPKVQYEFMTDPPQPQTMSVLKPSQVTFITLAKWTAEDHPTAFGCLDTWSKHLLLSTISLKGKGRDDIINYERSKRAPSGSSVNVISQLKEKAGKVKDKVKGDQD